MSVPTGEGQNEPISTDATESGPNFDVSFNEDQDAGTQQETQPEGVRRNPAWNTLLDQLPKPFHQMVEPVLQQWDAGVQQRFQKLQEQITPIRQFIDQQIDPAELLQSYSLISEMNQDPVAFFERYKQALISQGLLEEAKQVQQAQDQIEEQQEQEQFRDPRVDQLQQQQEEFLRNIQAAQAQQAQQEAQERLKQGINEELSFIESKTGPLPDWAKIELFDRAALMSQQQGRNVSLLEAYQSFQELRQNVLGTPRPGAQVPRVVPSGGGYPAPAIQKDALKTFDGRSAAIQDIIRRHQE